LPFSTGRALSEELINTAHVWVRGRVTSLKFPKAVNTYCPKCKSHTEHGVSVYKKGKERALSAGARRHDREKHGYGGQKWPELKRTAKTTKKQLLRLTCRKCNQTVYRLGIRLRKLEVGA
jgi:large subunit ribosomal protein L44e